MNNRLSFQRVAELEGRARRVERDLRAELIEAGAIRPATSPAAPSDELRHVSLEGRAALRIDERGRRAARARCSRIHHLDAFDVELEEMLRTRRGR